MAVRHFWQDRKASVAPLLAVILLPLMGAVGAGVDYARGNGVRTSMQDAIDSTALMLSKDAQNLSAGELAQKTSSYFNALFVRPEAHNVQITQQLTSPQAGYFKLLITASADLDTMFWRVVGQSQLKLTATTEVEWGIKKLNLALALDNTGSMSSSGKMSALKEAAHNLLTTLEAAVGQPGDIKVSIVPFAVAVNVGTDNVNADWIDWTDWDKENGTCSVSYYTSYNSCVNNNKVWTPKNHSEWNGCVKDRDQNNDVNSTATGAGSAVNYRAAQASNCPTPMMPLSTDWTALHNKVDAMTPTGNTNVTIGMQVAWQTLSAVAPFNAPPSAPDLDKVLVVLTDGQNTQNRWSTSTSSIDSRTEKVCANLRAANVKVYTVRVINGNATLLRNCATKPEMYYDVDEAVQLNSVFSSIAQNLANLRIVK